MLRTGRVADAVAYMHRYAKQCESEGTDASGCMQLQGDLQTMLGIDVDAEDSYREAQRLIRTSGLDLRAASCRNAGWQAYFRQRFGTAMSCFMRLADDKKLNERQSIEGKFGAVCVLLEIGQHREVRDMLEELVLSLNGTLEGGDVWREVIETLRHDLACQYELRAAAQFDDHVYWRSAVEVDAGSQAARDLSVVQSPLLRARIDHLDVLGRLAAQHPGSADAAMAHLNWAIASGLHAYEHAVRIEIALAAVAGGLPQLSEAMLSPVSSELRRADNHRHLEYLYCLAKTRAAQGRERESAQLYRRYTLTAMQCLRESGPMVALLAHRARRPPTQLDDVGARLPARYRRAYRYLMDNLDRSDLSVRELAAEAGVTERALQSAFKNSLGSTPTQIIRLKRMERIRVELQRDAVSGEHSVISVANRWGVQNRSTLVNGYRREFNEAPSDTLKR